MHYTFMLALVVFSAIFGLVLLKAAKREAKERTAARRGKRGSSGEKARNDEASNKLLQLSAMSQSPSASQPASEHVAYLGSIQHPAIERIVDEWRENAFFALHKSLKEPSTARLGNHVIVYSSNAAAFPHVKMHLKPTEPTPLGYSLVVYAFTSPHGTEDPMKMPRPLDTIQIVMKWNANYDRHVNIVETNRDAEDEWKRTIPLLTAHQRGHGTA